MNTNSILAVVATTLVTSTAFAETVQVTVTGVVEYNDFFSGPFSTVSANDDAILSFTVDSNDFVNHPTLPTRGYVIDQASYTLTLGTLVVGLQDPFPAPDTPYFVIRNDDPAVDGFFTATSLSADIGVPTDVPGGLGGANFVSNWKTTYGGDLLKTLDILDAVGTYDFTGLTVFNWAIEDGPFSPLGMVFDEWTIGTADCPPADLDGSGDVGFGDILEVISHWGFCPGCPWDLSGNGQVDFADILAVIGAWGPC
ncbi:MAG: hypothetical protein GY715_05730 [Planctomycetes bacterium]|nr:hypothetical protein [Planctomycetota bacterium]